MYTHIAYINALQSRVLQYESSQTLQKNRQNLETPWPTPVYEETIWRPHDPAVHSETNMKWLTISHICTRLPVPGKRKKPKIQILCESLRAFDRKPSSPIGVKTHNNENTNRLTDKWIEYVGVNKCSPVEGCHDVTCSVFGWAQEGPYLSSL